MSTADRIKERRLERMRMGQSVCDFVTLPSDPEIEVAIVPLREAEYQQVLNAVANLKMPDDLAGAAVKDRTVARETIVRAIREKDDLTRQVYSTSDEMMEDFDVTDVDHVFDCYNEMTYKASPSLDGLPPEEFEALKAVWPRVDWSALSGPAWYAARRFLSRIGQVPLLDKSSGSTSTS